MIPSVPVRKTTRRVSRFGSLWVVVFFSLSLLHLLAIPARSAQTGAAAGKVHGEEQREISSSSRTASLRTGVDPIGQWVLRNKEMPGEVSFNSIAHGDGVFVAVGEATVGGSCPIYTSPDGAIWTQQALPEQVGKTSPLLNDVTYGNGLFVAVGSSATNEDYISAPTILTSPDGVTWTRRVVPMAADRLSGLHGVVYGNGTFVAVGYYYTDDTFSILVPVALTSPDGVTWTRRTPPDRNQGLFGVGYGNGTFVAVGCDRTIRTWIYEEPAIITSPDGVTWTSQTVPPQTGGEQLKGISSVTYGSGLFVAAGYNYNAGNTKSVPTIFTSPNGVTWTQGTLPSQVGTLRSVTYGNGIFVTVGGDTYYGFEAVAFSSPDGVTWAQAVLPGHAGELSGVTYGNGIFVTVGHVNMGFTAPVPIFTSPDGVAWTRRTSASQNGSFSGITYGNDIFVVVGMSTFAYNPPALLTSSDGITWTEGTQPYAPQHVNQLSGIAYGNGTFVAVGYSCTNTWSDYTAIVLSSSDGITWTKGTAPVQDTVLTGVTYGNGTFVAVGYSYTNTTTTTAVVLFSSDGATWTLGALPVQTGALYGVTYGNGTFVSVGTSTFTSPDGTAWTRRTGNKLYGVTYGNGTFVATGANVFTSTDGIKWVQRTATSDYTLYGVTYGNGAFVVVGYYYKKDLPIVISSSDGITWTQWALPVKEGALKGVAFGNGAFVAVGDYGNIIQSQPCTSGCTLYVARSGTGTGAIVSSPDGIDCGSTCSASFAAGSSVTLNAAAATGSVFKSWTGCDSSSGNTCNVTMDKAKSVTATFVIANPVKLTVTRVRQNNGDGTVTSSPDGIVCGSTCSTFYATGTQVTLTASAGAGSIFASWSGCASFPGTTCTIIMDRAKVVKATFIGPQILNVKNTSVSKGSGTVTSYPGGINCSSGSCKGSFTYNTEVTLFANPGADSVFTGWSGCVSFSDTSCTVTMSATKTVKATFTGPQTLTVKNTSVSKGSGIVTSDVGDINCSSGSTGSCRTSLPYNTGVTLTAVPDDGSSVAGWSVSGCTGTACTVAMTKARSVTVKFKR